MPSRRLRVTDDRLPTVRQLAALHRVAHLADELLEDVLEEDDADGRARLVHSREMGAGALHRRQRVLDLVAGRDHGQPAHPPVRHRREARRVVGVEHVLDVQVADHLAAVPHREPAEPGVRDEVLDVVGRRARVDRDEVRHRHHDVPGRAVGVIAVYDAVCAKRPDGSDEAVHSCGHGPQAAGVVGAALAAAALRASWVVHAVTVASFAWFGAAAGLGWLWWVGVISTAAVLCYEHAIVRPHDLSRVNRAFFTANGVIGIGLFGFALVDLVVQGLRG